MIFNTLLKLLFKVPLFPHLGHGYAFPSGHMHASAVFYGYLLYKADDIRIKCALGALLGCIAFSLIYCNFHDLLDVLGAIIFAAVELTVYHVLSRRFGDFIVGVLAVSSAITTMLILSVIYKVEFHVWLAFYGLIGMELSLLTEDKRLTSIKQKFLALAISLVCILAVYYVFKFFAFNYFCVSEIRFALIPFIVVDAINDVYRLTHKRKKAAKLKKTEVTAI